MTDYSEGPDGTPERTAILDRARALLCGGRVYDDLPEAEQVPRDTTGEILPYIVITFSSPVPLNDSRLMAFGELNQGYMMGVQVDCWGPTRSIAGSTAGAARRVLLGFVPNEACDEIRTTGGAQFSMRAQGALPSRAMEQIRMLVPMNLSIPG